MAKFQGAIMVADVTGFTKLTEILSQQGHGGVELLTKCMNNVFCQVCLSLVNKHAVHVKICSTRTLMYFYNATIVFCWINVPKIVLLVSFSFPVLHPAHRAGCGEVGLINIEAPDG